MTSFKDLGLSSEQVKAVESLGFVSPTPVQELVIPKILQDGGDYIILAQTGTGKTAAFGLPLSSLLEGETKKLEAVIMCPTRELCLQVSTDLVSYQPQNSKLSIVAVYGGTPIDRQIRELKKGASIIVATPGRLMDIMSRNIVKFDHVRYVIMDEADEMLNMGFREDMDEILGSIPNEHNTWLFSATMPAEIRQIASKFMKSPNELTVGKKNQGAEKIEHQYYLAKPTHRYEVLKRIIDFHPGIFGLVFCKTKQETQEIAELMMRDGYNSDALHGDLSQSDRDRVMKRFRERTIQLLIATDVAARGIDVNNISHVINYGLPDDPEVYTHRSGRTARAGKSGVSICILTPKDLIKIKRIERINKAEFKPMPIPNVKDIYEQQLMHILQNLRAADVNEQAIKPFVPKIMEALSDLSKEDIITKFASLEFNRFLKYYSESTGDLNFYESISKQSGKSNSSSEMARMFINLGSVDGFEKKELIRYISDTAGVSSSAIHRVDIGKTFSFFNVDTPYAQLVEQSFSNMEFDGRRLRVNMDDRFSGSSSGRPKFEGKRGGGDSFREKRGSRGGFSGGGKRDFGKGGSRKR